METADGGLNAKLIVRFIIDDHEVEMPLGRLFELLKRKYPEEEIIKALRELLARG